MFFLFYFVLVELKLPSSIHSQIRFSNPRFWPTRLFSTRSLSWPRSCTLPANTADSCPCTRHLWTLSSCTCLKLWWTEPCCRNLRWLSQPCCCLGPGVCLWAGSWGTAQSCSLQAGHLLSGQITNNICCRFFTIYPLGLCVLGALMVVCFPLRLEPYLKWKAQINRSFFHWFNT